MRVDTTVVETNIHYPTDSSLLGDGARVLSRTMKKIETQTGKLKRNVRNRMRSVNKRVIAIAFSARHKGEEGEERRKKHYRGLLRLPGRSSTMRSAWSLKWKARVEVRSESFSRSQLH